MEQTNNTNSTDHKTTREQVNEIIDCPCTDHVDDHTLIM